jgi:hypothetical protein
MNTVAADTDDSKHSRIFLTQRVETLQSLPEALSSEFSSFVLFLSVDARTVPNESIRGVARRLLDRGLAYLCVWGPDCERVHDQFDLERDDKEQKGFVVMTTWHDEGSIEEALWFSITCAVPDDGFASAYDRWVGVSVGVDDWEQKIRAAIQTYGND